MLYVMILVWPLYMATCLAETGRGSFLYDYL